MYVCTTCSRVTNFVFAGTQRSKGRQTIWLFHGMNPGAGFSIFMHVRKDMLVYNIHGLKVGRIALT
jgi:hypothetical protein